MYTVSVKISSSDEAQVFEFNSQQDALKYTNQFRDLKVSEVVVTRLEDNRVIFKSQRKEIVTNA